MKIEAKLRFLRLKLFESAFRADKEYLKCIVFYCVGLTKVNKLIIKFIKQNDLGSTLKFTSQVQDKFKQIMKIV